MKSAWRACVLVALLLPLLAVPSHATKNRAEKCEISANNKPVVTCGRIDSEHMGEVR